MRWKHFVTPLIIGSLNSFEAHPCNSTFFNYSNHLKNNTIERSLTSDMTDAKINQKAMNRSSEYPTQIIRLVKTIVNQHVSCNQVNEHIDELFVNKITEDKFMYTTYISCTYDPETKRAINFSICSYFDPLNDEAISYLKNYLEEFNGADLFGSVLAIESAKALIVSLNLSVGMKKNHNKPPLIEYKEERSNLYFKNNYELHNKLIIDINKNFFSDEPERILPFLNKWLYNHAGIVYKAILRDSNYVLLEPERIFLMDNGEPLFVSPIKYYYANNCNKYEHHHCLKK